MSISSLSPLAEFMEDSIAFFLVLSILICTSIRLLTSILRPRRATNLPPGPPLFPFIGNISQLGQKPHLAHQILAHLAKTYGPIMHLKLGGLDTIVVSSPELAKQVLQKHDHILSGRHQMAVNKACNHDEASVVWLPVNAKWRTLRRICKDHMFSLKRLDSSQGLRLGKLRKLHDYMKECSEAGRVLDITDAIFTTTLNLISTSLFSMDFAQFHSDSSQELKGIVHGMLSTVATPNLADYFWVLKHVDPQSLKRKMASYMRKLFKIFDGIIDERLKSASVDSNDDFLDQLLKINIRNESELSRNDILHLLLDLFVAGVDTTSSTVEWAMAELIHNPEVMAKARTELHTAIGKDGEVEESDISRLPYLQAILKETFRLHPASALLAPHMAEAETQINGFVIPRKAAILVNIWASGRDPEIWPNPDCFSPGRFLGSNMDDRVQHFELIPFGCGRRMCPGLPLANRMVHLMVAFLIQGFVWRLEGGIKPEEMDMNEKFKSTLQKAVSLKAIPIKI